MSFKNSDALVWNWNGTWRKVSQQKNNDEQTESDKGSLIHLSQLGEGLRFRYERPGDSKATLDLDVAFDKDNKNSFSVVWHDNEVGTFTKYVSPSMAFSYSKFLTETLVDSKSGDKYTSKWEKITEHAMTRNQVYELIDGERQYQGALGKELEWSQDKVPRGLAVDGELVLLKVYLDKAYTAFANSNNYDASLDAIRKLAGICVRCMEHHGAPPRAQDDQTGQRADNNNAERADSPNPESLPVVE